MLRGNKGDCGCPVDNTDSGPFHTSLPHLPHLTVPATSPALTAMTNTVPMASTLACCSRNLGGSVEKRGGVSKQGTPSVLVLRGVKVS